MTLFAFAHTPLIKIYIAVKLFNPQKLVVFFNQDHDDAEVRLNLQSFFSHVNGVSVKFMGYTLTTSNIFAPLNEPDLLLLPPVELAHHVTLIHETLHLTCEKIFIEDDGEVYQLNHGLASLLNPFDARLMVKDFIGQTQGRILQTNSQLFKEKAASDLLDYFVFHLKTLKNIIKRYQPMAKKDMPSKPFDWQNPYSEVVLDKLNGQEQGVYLGALNLLKSHGILSYTHHKTRLDITFKDVRYRDYFAKVGTWLEHYTFRMLGKIQGIQDVNSSVFFMWNDDDNIKNELDIMAVYKNQLIAVSCKDTLKLVDDYLYELDSHADRLGNDDAIRAIVTTGYPTDLILKRADHLGIKLIVYTGNDHQFSTDLSNMLK